MSVNRLSRAALVAFLLAVAALHILRPEMDPARRYLSEYAIGRWGLLMTAAFFCVAVGAGALAVGWGRRRDPLARVAAAALLLYAGGMALAGIVPEGPLHNGGALAAFPAVVVALFAVAGVRRSLLGALLALAAAVALAVLVDAAATGSVPIGLAQRAFVLLHVAGLLAAGSERP